MKIREATIDDVPQMRKLWYELMNYHAEHHMVFRAKEDAEKLIEEDLKSRIEGPDFRFFIYEIEDRIVGYIATSYRITQKAMIYNKRGYIADTVVDQKFRGKGIGNSLFEKAQQWFEEQGADHIELQVSLKNEGAMNFWENQGFSGSTQHMIKYLRKKD
jgi:ribosomal protein S18 acetylase RimI-like enzyme